MAGEANAAEFEGAAYKVNFRAAQGLDSVPGDKDRVTGGIFLPEPEKLRGGTTIFRFGNSAVDLDRDRFGRWWMARETLELLVQYAGDAESLVWIARQHLAVPPGFSSLNRLFTADLRQTVRAFGGVGGLVFEDPPAGGASGRTTIWPGGAELTGTPTDRTMKRQLFIPGLAKAPAALSFRPVQSVAEWLSAYRRGGG
jgi:hypothetical protein